MNDKTQKLLRAVLFSGYLGFIALVMLWPHGPRAFWTIFFPVVPIVLVLVGYHVWRRICPLAMFNAFGRRVPRTKQRRVSAFLEKHSYTVSLSALAAGLMIRLLFINGDGIALGIFLVAIALAAFVVGVVYTGKTWCNFFCPVGIVEKIYTEPANLYAQANSQCPKCTACKKHCPDIDEENHYWKELESPSRRTAYYAFPGLVWGFYTAFALPRGTYQDYFSGAWTHLPQQYRLVSAPGLFFASMLPRAVVMPAFLVASAVVSYGVFRFVENVVVARFVDDKIRVRHVTLTLAAFVAFVSFYLFAGQPTYRRLHPLPVLMSIVTVLTGTLFLARRFRRNEEDYVQERAVKKLLSRWSYDEAPPKDPKEVFAFVKSKERERERILAVYSEAIADVLADGVVDQTEHRMLEKLRSEFGISKQEHDKVLARLSAEERDLFDPTKSSSIEQRLQLDGYKLALQGLLVSRPTNAEMESLRRSYDIDPETHAKLLESLRATDSPLRLRALEQLDVIDQLRADMADLANFARIRAFQLVYLVLLRQQASAVERTLEILGVLRGNERKMRGVASRLSSEHAGARAKGLEMLAEIDADISRRLEPVIQSRRPTATNAPDAARLSASLTRMMDGQDPILAGAALLAAAVSQPDSAKPHVARMVTHPHPFIRESSAIAAALAEADAPAILAALREDPDPRVRATVESLSLPPEERDGTPRLAGQVNSTAAANVLATMRGGPVKIDAGDFGHLPTPERMLVLAAIPLFSELPPEHLYEIATLATERTLAPGDILCTEGEPGDEVFVLIGGSGEVYRGEGAERSVVGHVKSGDCVGELAVLDEAPRSATIRAGDPMRVLVIEGAPFRGLMSQQPDLSAAVLEMVTRRLRDTLAKVPGLAGRQSITSQNHA